MVARQLDERIAAHFEVGRRLRVLDIGLGEGNQALRLLRAGHQVTGLESDPTLLAHVRGSLERQPEGIRERFRVVPGSGQDTGAHFLPGTFDVVLCHDVLDQARDPDSTLAGLARVLDAGGLLSLVIPNVTARAMRPGLAGDWEGALESLTGPAAEGAEGQDQQDRFLRLESLTSFLTRIGVPLVQWYGVGVFSSDEPSGAGGPAEVPDGTEASVAAEIPAARSDAEERAGRTDPYRAVAASLHLCGVRG
ncbi:MULTISPECIES: class I SAM-dependent methyltransferase [unclassified Streptomyces]|uniref:class I SAM-dependent methyltransferase n=1 Tax=unclassified Streptomyces TaxID=2593676 RepID=UPI002DD81178|nr:MULTISPECIES: class I SAM-dependent methyltransferase [unclassified Streptomyces]WSA97378.1 class I SAM-dependent methyltransferase [Streptomyces sp. NBC_01795]WSB81807.1 class I SAM-dependent methyltransferase [Streptomyces sp. NBC_01775]WSS17428.1 class I SAM-dependent methyltransferase [Streptomyces sp. NBC_01186]WSS46176.1 class I SAM-dependent methyltransferase [Streptomyces sp. NBC_01187]